MSSSDCLFCKNGLASARRGRSAKVALNNARIVRRPAVLHSSGSAFIRMGSPVDDERPRQEVLWCS